MRWCGMAVMCLAVSLPGLAAAPKRTVNVQLANSQGQAAGTVMFVQKGDGPVKVKIALKNLPFGEHGVHIHEHASCEAPDFKTAGGHFNPDGRKHGFENPMGHHNGDLPQNVNVGEDHTGSASFTITSVTLAPGVANSLFANGGTSVVVHEHADDMKTDPSGNSGNRIACGVIQQ